MTLTKEDLQHRAYIFDYAEDYYIYFVNGEERVQVYNWDNLVPSFSSAPYLASELEDKFDCITIWINGDEVYSNGW